MRRKKKKPAGRKPAQMRWEFGPDIPTHDFLEGGSLEDTWNLQEAVENFVSWVEEGHFLTWEAVVCEEQGLPLTAGQKKALRSLLSFNDEEDDQILYIDELPRPSQPWHVIINKIAPHLLTEPYDTAALHTDVHYDGWPRLVAALEKHGQGLSLPAGTHSVKEVVPGELRHKLWLQYCFNDLGGLGQEDELTLANEEQLDRMDSFIAHLREYKESIAYFGLTLESLLTRLILPERDRPIFIKRMQDKLGLGFAQDRIADRL